LVTVSETE